MLRGPVAVFLAAIVDRFVGHLEHAELLEVRVRDAPPASQILVEAVSEQIAERLVDPQLAQALQIGVRGIVRELKSQAVEDPLR